MSNSRSQTSPHNLVEDLVDLTSRGVITGFARDTYPGGESLRWIISGPGQSTILYLDTVECRAYVKGAKQALASIESRRR